MNVNVYMYSKDVIHGLFGFIIEPFFDTNRPRERWESTGRSEFVLRSLLAGENGEANLLIVGF
jgi:hypothetical protein